jgi:hypothetical protein
MPVMAKEKEPKTDTITLYVRLDRDTSDCLRAYIEAQDVAPSNAAVTIKALRTFLSERGFWPPRRPKAPPRSGS